MFQFSILILCGTFFSGAGQDLTGSTTLALGKGYPNTGYPAFRLARYLAAEYEAKSVSITSVPIRMQR